MTGIGGALNAEECYEKIKMPRGKTYHKKIYQEESF